MRKIWAVFAMAFVLVGLGACAGEGGPGKKMFDFKGVAYIVLRDGDTGNAVAIRDPADLERLRDMFYAPRYEKHISSEEYTGWGWWLQWYSEDGETVEDITVQGADRIRYKDAESHEYFWKVSGGEIDTAYLDELLERAPEAGVADLNPRMEYVRGEPFSVTIEDAAGNLVDIRDSGLMGEILDDLLGLTFVVGEASQQQPAYTVMWGTEDKELIDSVMIVDASTVWRSGHLYCAADGEIDISRLQKLLEDPPPIQQDVENARAVLAGAFDITGANNLTVSGQGASTMLGDVPEVQEVAGELAALEFTAPESYEGEVGAAFYLVWSVRDEYSSQPVAQVSVVDAQTIRVGNTYFVTQGQIDLERLERLAHAGD